MVNIRTSLPLTSIDWGRVCRVMCQHRGYTSEGAEQASGEFRGRFGAVLNPYLFTSRSLSTNENDVAAALCEVSGSDGIELTTSREILSHPFRVTIAQTSRFDPKLNATARGSFSSQVDVGIGGRSFTLRSFWGVLLVDLLAVLFTALSYVAVLGVMLYGMAVFLVLLEIPDLVAKAALNKWSVGLGLLSFLVAMAAISGRALRNLIRLTKITRKPRLG